VSIKQVMKSKSKTNKIIIILCILFALVVVLLASHYLLFAIWKWYYPIGNTELAAMRFSRLIMTRYIKENNGNFPSSEDDLLDKKFIKKTKTDNGYDYYLNLGLFPVSRNGTG